MRQKGGKLFSVPFAPALIAAPAGVMAASASAEMPAGLAIHDKRDGKPHAHIMQTVPANCRGGKGHRQT